MKRVITLFILAIFILCCGCTQNDTPTSDTTPTAPTKTTLTTPTETTPTQPELTEDDRYTFSEITSVTLYQDGSSTAIDASDLKVTNLLAFLSNAVSKQTIQWMQGHATAEHMAYMESAEPRLEIEFSNSTIGGTLFEPATYDKLIIVSSTCTCVYNVDDSYSPMVTYAPNLQAGAFIPYSYMEIGEWPEILLEFGFLAQ